MRTLSILPPDVRRRGVAILLAMIATIVSSIVAYTYLASQETSIALARNLRNHAQARFIAESGLDLAIALVKSNGNWRTAYTHGTWVSNASLLGGTIAIKGEDGQDSNGDGVISNPAEGDGNLADDASDLLTLTVTATASGATAVSRAVLTPQAGSTMIVYGEQSQAYCRYRTLSGSSWSNEQSAQDVGTSPKWFIARSCPTRTEVAVTTLNNANDIYLQFWTGSAWTSATLLTTSAGISSERPYDLAYEQSSGDLLIAYRAASGSTLRYRTASSSGSVSAESTLTLPTSGNVKWVKLIPKPASNEIVAMTLDGNKEVGAVVWNGSAWGNAIQLETKGFVSSNEEIAGAYEGLSGHAMVAWVEKSKKNFHYRTWNGSAWSAQADSPTLPKDSQWLRLAADPTSDDMIMVSMDGDPAIILCTWNGSAWGGSPLTVETNATGSDRRCFDVAYERTGGKAIAVWGRTAQNNFFYRTWNGSSWSSEQAGPGLTDKVSVAQLMNDGSSNQIYLSILQKGSGELESMIWNGSSFSARVELESNCSGPNSTESYMVASSPASGGSSSGGYLVDWRN